MEAPYEPKWPYYIQSGHFKDETAERLMLRADGYEFLRKQLDRREVEMGVNGRPDEFHLHLRGLMKRGDNLPTPTNIVCPQCRIRPIAMVSILRDGRSELSPPSRRYSCCVDAECRFQLETQSWGVRPFLIPLKFSSILLIASMGGRRQDKSRFIDLLKMVHGLQETVDVGTAFEFFWGYPPQRKVVRVTTRRRPKSLVLMF